MEFLHSLTSFYCSLCDTFMRDKGEALRHPESKMHVSKYKIHRAQNPLFESTFLKAKTTAYAKYKVDEERKKMENELNLNEKTVSLENKLLKQIKEKYEKESKEERQSDSQDDSGRNCGSIRVASRGPRHSSDKKPSKGSDDSRRKSDSLRHSNDEPQTSQKYEPKESEGGSNVDNVGGHEKTSIEDQRESKYKEGSKDVDADRKPVSSKLPLIGKMPFLKRKSGMTKNKEQQSTPVEEQPKLKKESSEEFNLSEIIPLPKPEARDSDVRKSSQKVEEIKKPLTVKPVAKEKPLTVKPVAKEKPLTVKPVAPPVECPVTSVVSEDKTMMKNIPDAPLLLDTEKTSETEEKDTHGSDLYDPLEAGDEDSSDGAAAATIEALDLLNIPLPGFKTSLDSQKTSSTPPLSETEDKYQPEDMEIESTPLILEEEGMEEGKICPLETVHPPAGMIVHPGISLMAPPPVNLSNPPLHMNLSNPPPINLNNPPPPINLNNPPPPINLSTPPPPINLNPPPPMNLNNPPPPINLSNPLPINLNTPPPPISLSNTLPLMSLNNLPPPRSSSDPPPPGTEEPAFSSRDEGNNIVPTGNVLPAFGSQEFIAKSTPPPIDIQRQNDSQIPLPPGTEDEHTTREIPTLSYSSGKLEDKVDEVDTQRQPLQLFSPKGNSMDVPLSLSDNVIKGSLKSTKEPSKTPRRNKNLPHDREKESTPPPPGTEGFSSEADSHDSNESNKLSTSDLESLKSLSVSSDLEIHANKEKLKLSQESKSSPNVSKAESSSSNLQSNPDQFSDSESGVSENVQQDEKDSSGKCLTSDTRHEELGSYPAKDVRSHSLSPKASDKGNVATSHGGMEKNSCTPSKEPDKESITTAHSSTEERSRTPPREPDLVKGEAALDYKNEKSCSTLPPTELDPEYVFSSNRIQEGPLTLPTKEIDTEKIATPCESQEWSHKPQDQHSTVKSKEVASPAIMSESYTLPLKQSDTENIAPPCGSEEQLHTPITKQPDIGNIAPPCGSEEQLHTPLTKQPDIGNIAPPCGSEEQLHTPQTEQLDTGNIAPPCDSVEQLHTPLTKQPDTGNIAPPCDSEEQLHTPLTKQPDTGNIAPPCGSEGQLHTPITEQPDTEDIAPPCESEEQLHTLLTEQPDTGNIAPPCDNVEQLHTPLTEQPDTGNIAPPCDSVEQLHTPLTEQPDTGNIAPPCDSVEQLHTPITEQPDTGNIAPPCDSVEQLHTPLTKQPDTGNIAPPCGSEGQLHTPITEQPDTEDIAPPCESEEQLHTLLTEQPDIGDISPPSDSEGQLHTPQTEQPDTGDIAPTCESEERPHTAQTEEPDVGDKTISAATNEERPFTHPPEILTALHGSDNKRSCTSPDLQPSTRNITASHDNERNICTSPSLQLNTRISTMAPGSDEERSCATPLTQLDAGSQVTSQNVLLPQLDRDLSYPEGNSAVEFSTWTRLMEKNELTESKMTPSDNENFNKNPSSQSSTVDTDDNKNKQDTSSEDEGESIEDRSHTLSSKQHDTGNIPSSSKLSVNQESAESLVSEEWRLNVQDSNSLSILKDSTQDSTECCDIMIERNLTQKSDEIDKPESPVMKPKSPVQMINFHKSFESMDIAELYLPSRSDSVCTQSINPSKFVSPHTGDKGTSDTVKNVSDMYEENSETIEGKIDDEQGINNEMDKKNQDSGVRIEETKSVRDTSCGQSKEPLREELETSTVECSDSSKDSHSQKSTDSETETFPHDISDEDGGTRSMQKVQKEGYTSDEASKETEDITVEESAASTDKTHSSEDEVVTTASKKGRKRKQQNTRKTPRKRVAQFEWAEEDECIPSRTNTSRSSASRQTQSVVESPRPMRSSRRAAAAAIKAMAKNQDDTPPDSPPSDNDTDYSD
ncbi:uncharacterized protein LOC127009671 isoform X2 [Eriocheir sinensis]|nr:uncharacterized protein LOC127009671 isoform X2 [Eriocheir sinensis]